MSSHRFTRFLGVLIILTAIFFFAVSVGAVVLMSNGGLRDTFGAGWTGWFFLPVIAGALMTGVLLLAFGSVLLLLTRIDDNLRTAVIRRLGRPVEEYAPVEVPAVVVPVAQPAVVRPAYPVAPEEPDAVAEPLLPDLQSAPRQDVRIRARAVVRARRRPSARYTYGIRLACRRLARCHLNRRDSGGRASPRGDAIRMGAHHSSRRRCGGRDPGPGAIARHRRTGAVCRRGFRPVLSVRAFNHLRGARGIQPGGRARPLF